MPATPQSLEDAALEKCEQDPISTPGAIQPFGCLIGLDKSCDNVLYCTENLQDYLGFPAKDALGGKASALFSADFLHDLRNVMSRSSAKTQRILICDLDTKEGTCSVSAHMPDDIVQVELCDQGAIALGEGEALSRMRWLMDFTDNEDISALVEKAVHLLREFSGYDRVKCYRFRPDGSGEVVAESRMPFVDSYLGLRFPSFDIPPQVRLLYAKTPIRMISDVDAQPVHLLGHDGSEPLDMSLTLLRATMPVHLEYLRNMEVRATMTLPLVVGGKLWGLFAFHHRTPRFLGGSAAMALEFAGKLLGMRIGAALNREQSELQLQSAGVCEALFLFPSGSDAERLAWNISKGELAGLMPSNGVAFWHEGFYISDGICPPEEVVRELASQLDPVEDGIFITDKLPLKAPDKELGGAAGALLIDLDEPGGAGFMFFRAEVKQSITWAGSPEKIVNTTEKIPRLTPRGSFKAFVQYMENRSDAWENNDISIARGLRQAAQRTLAHRENWSGLPETVQLIQELNHRVRNILSLVQSIIRQSKPRDNDIDGYLASLEARILSLANAHNALTLRSYQALDLRDLIMLEAEPFPADQISLAGPQVGIEPNASTLMILIMHELFSNAAKYGALSERGGRLMIHWNVTKEGVVLNWRETGGPKVRPPASKGLGHTIINNALTHELGGRTEQSFEPNGVRVEMVLPSEAVRLDPGQKITPVLDVVAEATGPESLGCVLIVDDDFMIAQTNKALLEGMGAENCLLASNNEAAAALIETKSFDLAVLDINLRRTLSTPTAQRLADKDIPFLFVTGYDSGTVTQKEFPYNPVIRKPISKAELAAAIAQAQTLGTSHGL